MPSSFESDQLHVDSTASTFKIPRKPVPRSPSTSSPSPGLTSPTRTLPEHRLSKHLLSPFETDLSNDTENQSDSNHERSRGLAQLKDWWWEMGACIISITGCGLLVGVIKSLDQQPISSWQESWSIEPNTVLAIISAVSRTAMMVPVASCLSQLKWRHFQRRRHPLSHLDLIDRASRGPWGSFQVLLKLGKANITISVLAVTTILSLAVGPSVQQILETRTREVPSTKHHAEVAYAKNYTSRAASNVSYPTINLTPANHFDFLSALIRGIVDPVQPNFACTAQRCTWPDFTTIGICHIMEDLTESTTRTCLPLWSQALLSKNGTVLQDNSTWTVNCTYKLPKHSYEFAAIDMVTYTPTEPQLEIDWVFRSLAHAQVAGSQGVIDDPQYLKTNAYRGDANLTVNGEKIHHSMPVVVAEVLSTGPRSESDSAGPPDVSVHRVLFYPCAQTYRNLSATPEAMPMPGTKILSEPMGFVEDDDLFTDLYQVPSTGEIMIFHNFSHLLILEFLFSFFSPLSANVVFGSDMGDEEYMLTVAHFTVEKTLGPWVWHNGVGRAIKNIVTTLSSLIRNDELGDNMAAQMLEGVAWETEVFFNVRWAWITVIIVETLCITILLAISMALTWRDSLVKDSSFALLLHGLEGWDTLRLSGPETTSFLDKMAKGMTAKLEAGEDGVLRFQKQDQEGNGESMK